MNYSFTQIRKGIILVESDTQHEIGSMFMRPQEFYESPYKDIRGHFFTIEQYTDIYTKDKGAFTYLNDWSGFNIPSDSFKDFIKTFQFSFTMQENFLVKGISSLIPNLEGNFYIIGVCKDKSNKEILAHEIAHAFWCLDNEYREKMSRIIKELPSNWINDAVRSLVALGYDRSVVEDEIHAYMSTTIDHHRIINIFGWEKYSKIRIPRKIRKFYEEYSSTNK
jgi:hypothetical protein